MHKLVCTGAANAYLLVPLLNLVRMCAQGNIAAWKKKEGDEIAVGDVLCEVETDKVR